MDKNDLDMFFHIHYKFKLSRMMFKCSLSKPAPVR